MIQIKLDDIDYNMPESWNEVSLGRMMIIDDLKNSGDISSLELSAYILEALSSIPAQLLLEIPLQDLTTLSNLIGWMQTMPTKKVKKVKIDDIEYVPIDLNNMSAGEMISLEVFQKENAEKNLHFISAILIRPQVDGKIEKLKDMMDINARAELFKEKLMVGDLWPIVNDFFSGAALSSLTNSQDSSGFPKSLSRLQIVNSSKKRKK